MESGRASPNILPTRSHQRKMQVVAKVYIYGLEALQIVEDVSGFEEKSLSFAKNSDKQRKIYHIPHMIDEKHITLCLQTRRGMQRIGRWKRFKPF